MRVLVLTQGFPRHERDHHATFVLDHARALSAAGIDVTVLCPSGPGLVKREHFGDIEVVRFRYAPRRLETLAYTGAMHRRAAGPAAVLLPMFLIGFVGGALREARRADVVHGHWWLPSGVVAVTVGALLGKPSVVHLHGTDAAVTRGPLRLLAKLVLRRASAALAVSKDLTQWADSLGAVEARLAPMPLGRWVPDPSPAPADGPVLAVGRMVPEKGFDVLVHAAARAGVPVVIAGDGDLRGSLEELIARTGAPVRLVGSVAPADLAGLYRSARAVVVPSRREGFGLVAAEGLAAGRTVIASDIGGLRDLVRAGENGVAVPVGDVDALARALETVDPNLGARGPETVTHLRAEEVGRRELESYRGLAAPRPLARPLLRAGAALFTLAALAFCVMTISSRWDAARGVGLRWAWWLVAVSVVAIAAADLVMAWAWGWLLRRLGQPAAWQVVMRVWWMGQLGRWLPTGLGSVPARLAAGSRAGLATIHLLRATAAEPAAAVVGCLLLAVFLLPVVAAAALGLAVAVAVTVAGRRWRTQLGFLALQTAQTAVRGVGFWALLGLAGGGRPPLLVVVGATGLAYGLGFLAVFAPGGIGVREAVLAAALSSYTEPQTVAAVGVVWRLLEVVVELPLTLWSRMLRQPRPAAETLEATAP